MSAVVLLAGLAGCRAEIGDNLSGANGNGNPGGDLSSMPPSSTGKLDVGTVPIHRLSNTEYDNTVRDLLGTSLQCSDAADDITFSARSMRAR